MGTRGRTSTASLSVVTDVSSFAPPEPPDDLNDDQADTWRAVVASQPPGWFKPDTFPLLLQYCRHVSRGNQLGKMINEMEKKGIKDHKSYFALLNRETAMSNIIAQLATKMRLSQQSSYDRRSKKAKSSSELWET